MSETQTPTVENESVDIESIIANSPFAKPIHITRNGVTVPLKVFVGQRGEWKDKPYAAVQIETDDTSEVAKDHSFIKDLTFIGKSNVKNALNVIFRRYGQDFFNDSVSEETGEFSLDKFTKSWENLTATGLKLSELKELLDNEQKKQEAFIAGEGIELLGRGRGTPEFDKALKIIEDFKKSIKALRFDLDQRAARRSKEKETDTVAPA